jgi:predicted nucleic acid-binding protein
MTWSASGATCGGSVSDKHMRLVVADTGPINYLILIEAIDLLPKLFETIFVPKAVRDELAHVDAPATVQAWIAQVPAWLEVRPNPDCNTDDATAASLDDGERAAIALAVAIGAELILMDDRAGVAVAYQKGLTVTGTLGVLDLAARRGLIDLGAAFGRLKATNFRHRPEIMDALLAQQPERQK